MPGKPSSTTTSHRLPERIGITGMGFVSPVGMDLRGAAQALREKSCAFHPDVAVLVADDRYGTTLRGATVSIMPAETVSRWMSGTERAVALLGSAVRQCIAGVHPWNVRNALWQVDNLLEPDDRDFRMKLQRALPDALIAEFWGRDESMPDFSRGLFFERIIQGAEMLRRGRNDEMAFVGCMDSLVTVSRLNNLLQADRLKDAANPEGIEAGEAAGVILLEKESHARRRNAPVYATIASWGRGTDPEALGGAPTTGRGLAHAFREAFAGLDDEGASVGVVVADLNGERPRAVDWAYAEGHVFAKAGHEHMLRHPADTVGDCGGAMGVALMVDALGCFMLADDAPHRVALATSDEGGARRVICLERGDSFSQKG